MTIHEQARKQHEAHKTARAATYDTPTARAKRHERAAALFNPTGTPRARAAIWLASARVKLIAASDLLGREDARHLRAHFEITAADDIATARTCRQAAT